MVQEVRGKRRLRARRCANGLPRPKTTRLVSNHARPHPDHGGLVSTAGHERNTTMFVRRRRGRECRLPRNPRFGLLDSPSLLFTGLSRCGARGSSSEPSSPLATFRSR